MAKLCDPMIWQDWPDKVQVIDSKSEEFRNYYPERTCHIETRVIDGIEEDFCTACGNDLACYYQPHYCPACGAKVV